MTRLLMLVEGQTEETFVKQTLTPHLKQYGVHIESPILIWTKRRTSGGGFRGGVSTWRQIHENLRPLTSDGNAWISTILDFYQLPSDFPGLPEIMKKGSSHEKAIKLQERFALELKNHPRFIPFLTLHEFEAWIFSSPDVVAAHFGNSDLTEKLRSIVQQAGSPELINHGEHTHPEAQLKRLVGTYKKTSDGPNLLSKIGIAAVREACPHFDAWLRRLETLGKVQSEIKI